MIENTLRSICWYMKHYSLPLDLPMYYDDGTGEIEVEAVYAADYVAIGAKKDRLVMVSGRR